MDRGKRIVNLMLNSVYVSVEKIMSCENVSRRTVINAINMLKQDQKEGGYKLETIRGKGYSLTVIYPEKFKQYQAKDSMNDDRLNNQDYRIHFILNLLFQQKNFITIQDISDCMNVGRTTIIKDLNRVRKLLEKEDLALLSKSHYGIQIVGNELTIRNFFVTYIINAKSNEKNDLDYIDFVNQLDDYDLTRTIKEIFVNNQILFTNSALFSIELYLKVLLYRLNQRNLIPDFKMDTETDNRLRHISDQISNYLEKKYEVNIPQREREYLCAQIAGKSSLEKLTEEEEKVLSSILCEALKITDKQFLTKFSKDEELKKSLLLHIHSLIRRANLHVEIPNPLIDIVSTKYANAFLIAIRFNQLMISFLGEDYTVTRDEVGYLALHFASNLEKQTKQIVSDIKRIIVISNGGRGADLLLKMKIEKAFPYSLVAHRKTMIEIEIKNDDYDLLMTTNDLDGKFRELPIFKVSMLPSDNELQYLIKQIVLFKETNDGSFGKNRILNLFSADTFTLYKRKVAIDYEELLHVKCEELVQKGFAHPNFSESVLKREKSYSTVYKNGIAGPHGMQMSAYKDTISVSIFKEPIYSDNKKIQLLFLLNIKKGNLFLYKEISNLLMKVIDNDSIRMNLANIESYEEFIDIISKLI